MNSVAQHIDRQSYLFETPRNKISRNLSVFLLRVLTNWYANKLDNIRAEISGFLFSIEKKEIPFDYNSYLLFGKIFGMVYSFNETLSQEPHPQLYKVKMSLHELCDSLKTLLITYEKENFSDHKEALDIAQDDQEWISEIHF